MKGPTFRLNVRTMMFAITGIAILLVHPMLRGDRSRRSGFALVLGAVDGDADALARAVVSPEVLDDALTRTSTLATLPRFSTAKDRRGELLRVLRVQPSSNTHTVRVGMLFGPQHDLSIILHVLAESYRAILGPNRVAVLGTPTLFHERSFFQESLPEILLMIWIQVWAWSRWTKKKKREKDRAKSQMDAIEAARRRGLLNTPEAEEASGGVEQINDLLLAGKYAEAVRRYRELTGKTWGQSDVDVTEWTRLDLHEKLSRFGFEPRVDFEEDFPEEWPTSTKCSEDATRPTRFEERGACG